MGTALRAATRVMLQINAPGAIRHIPVDNPAKYPAPTPRSASRGR
jgi:hypothetical protein